jgi:hypothetical protein
MRDLIRAGLLLSVLGFVLAGCMASDQEVLGGGAELRGGCRTVCPHCAPNRPCPRIACYLDCHGQNQTREQCGDVLCPAGEVCCNSSCGICTPPDGACIDLYCAPAPATTGCNVDADCTTFSNYCDGCSCQALFNGTPEPLCAGTTVSCFADPCMNVAAYCDTTTHTCTLGDAVY